MNKTGDVYRKAKQFVDSQLAIGQKPKISRAEYDRLILRVVKATPQSNQSGGESKTSR